MSFSRSQFMALLATFSTAGLPATANASRPPWYPLPPPLPIGKGRALVLSGGGAKGAYEVGALKWLFKDVDRSGAPFDVVCGTSAGAINAAFAACGTYNAIERNEQLWREMPSANIMQYVPPVRSGLNAAADVQESAKHGFPRKLAYFGRAGHDVRGIGPTKDLAKIMGIVSNDGIRAVINKYVFGINDLHTSLIITASNVTNLGADAFYRFCGKRAAEHEKRFLRRAIQRYQLGRSSGAPPLRSFQSRRYPLTQENFAAAILASTSVPGIFAPVPIQPTGADAPNAYVDGSIANNIPIGLAIDAGANDITVLMVSTPTEAIPKPPETLFQLLYNCYTLMQLKILENDVILAFAKSLLARHPDVSGLNPTAQAYLKTITEREWTPITVRLIWPNSPLALGFMSFNDAEGIAAAIESGYRDAQHPYVYSMG